MFSKEALRELQRQKLSDLSFKDRKKASNLIVQGLKEFISQRKMSVIAAYSPLPLEVDLSLFYEDCLRYGYRLAFPRIIGNELEFRCVTNLSTDLVAGASDLKQATLQCPRVMPAALSLVLVPGFAFDRRGFRVGFGKGFYDRFF